MGYWTFEDKKETTSHIKIFELKVKMIEILQGTPFTLADQLTKREELSLRMVLALPQASRGGLAWMTWSSRLPYTFFFFKNSH